LLFLQVPIPDSAAEQLGSGFVAPRKNAFRANRNKAAPKCLAN